VVVTVPAADVAAAVGAWTTIVAVATGVSVGVKVAVAVGKVRVGVVILTTTVGVTAAVLNTCGRIKIAPAAITPRMSKPTKPRAMMMKSRLGPVPPPGVAGSTCAIALSPFKMESRV
jgi:hypothetical protein